MTNGTAYPDALQEARMNSERSGGCWSSETIAVVRANMATPCTGSFCSLINAASTQDLWSSQASPAYSCQMSSTMHSMLSEVRKTASSRASSSCGRSNRTEPLTSPRFNSATRCWPTADPDHCGWVAAAVRICGSARPVLTWMADRHRRGCQLNGCRIVRARPATEIRLRVAPRHLTPVSFGRTR